MEGLFQNILVASFHGSIVIVAVILLRLVLKKTPKKFICLLWMLAGLRLLMPFEIQSTLSLQPQPVAVAQQQVWQSEAETEPELGYPLPSIGPMADPEETVSAGLPGVSASGTSAVQDPASTREAAPAEQKSKSIDWLGLLPYVWLTVACGFAVASLYSYLCLKWQVREAIKIPGGWECEHIDTAFILGFIKPKIYIPMGMSPVDRKYILSHERTHLEKGDHWFKMIGYLALALHWFNPLVWVAYTLLCKDIEMACDERVVQFMDVSERKSYSAALLSCSTNRAHFAACSVAFGEVSVKYRIKSVLNYRRPSFWISLLGVIAILFVAVCLVTSPVEKEGAAAGETTAAETEVVVVKNVDELLDAIAPNTEIQMEPGTYNLSQAKNYGKDSDYYIWGGDFDGYSLGVRGVDNLTIRGGGKLVTNLQTDPRYAYVLTLVNCSNVTLEDFTAGHTDGQGECTGGVVLLQGCNQVDMNRLGLYGCGVLGLKTENCRDITLADSDVYECSSQAVELNTSDGVSVTRCRLYDIGNNTFGGYAYFSIYGCQDVMVSDCEISDSALNWLIYESQSTLTLQNNLFARNRPEQAAFFFESPNVVLDSNRFEDNNIRSWYEPYSTPGVDKDGNALAEDDLVDVRTASETQPQLEIHVSTVDELIAAIGPNKDIVLDGELYDFSTATGYGTSKGDYYYWEDIYDGPGLVIQSVENLTIRSNDGNVQSHTIAAIPRYADVLTFRSCSNISLSGFTAGHTKEPGVCAGGVLSFRDSDGISVNNCGLFGCGILGIQTEYCSDLKVTNCDIYECSQGGIKLWDTDGIVLENNTFRDLGGEEMTFVGCSDLTLDGQQVNPNDVLNVTWQMTNNQTDQTDAENLESTALDFANAYFAGDVDAMKLNLSANYALPVTAYEQSADNLEVLGYRPPLYYASDMETKGCCLYAVHAARGEEDIQLTMELCRENGVWKIQYYTTGDTEVEMLDRDLVNFFWAYIGQDRDEMAYFLDDSFTRPVELYSGDSNTSVDDSACSVAETYSNAELAQLNTYSAAIPFKETADSDSYTYLNVALRRRENKKVYEENGYQRTDTEWVVTDYGLEK